MNGPTLTDRERNAVLRLWDEDFRADFIAEVMGISKSMVHKLRDQCIPNAMPKLPGKCPFCGHSGKHSGVRECVRLLRAENTRLREGNRQREGQLSEELAETKRKLAATQKILDRVRAVAA